MIDFVEIHFMIVITLRYLQGIKILDGQLRAIFKAH